MASFYIKNTLLQWHPFSITLEIRPINIGKSMINQLAFSALVISSALEAIAYIGSIFILLPFYSIFDVPIKILTGLAVKSIYTFLFSVGFVCANPILLSINLFTESENRRRPIQLRRPLENRGDIAQPSGTNIEQGAALITQIITNATANNPAIKNAFKDKDSEIFSYLAIKAVYIYTLEDAQKKASIPTFFKPEVRDQINNLRQNYRTKVVSKDCLSLVNRLIGGITQPEISAETLLQSAGYPEATKQNAKMLFEALYQASIYELQASLLLTKCYQHALDHFPNR